MRIDGKCVVVTGGASGIGAALARRFAAEGARGVVVADVQKEPLDAVARESGDALAVQCDVTDEAQLRSLVDRAEDRFGPIDLFCSNA
ncbi:MAG TPA: SDR family NAD(P)-dependent oxidoreductase, partial [Acidimicrobiia bacterium]